ncbi:CDC50/LEM3 family [Phlyctochytrium arcticum]|nr:CDC50/LEM3 family [Phlyctochytrium arcticum]
MSEVVKSKRPDNTAFKQQRLKAWQPILTPKSVLPAFFLVGAIFIPLGIGLYIASERVHEVAFDYTQCKTKATSTFSDPGASFYPIKQWRWDAINSQCAIQFEINEIMAGPVFMYYRLTNFYQNHRRYVKSFDASQLKGDRIGPDLNKKLTNCEPLRTASPNDSEFPLQIGGVNQTMASTAQVYPCGLIANSMFSDDISGLQCITSNFGFPNGQLCPSVQYPFNQDGIAWPSDKERYDTTSWASATDEEINTNLIPPPLWRTAFPQWRNGYNKTNLPKLKEWEAFQVWMRTAALPTFRKLYGRNGSALPPGTWELTIRDSFDTEKFSGSKSLVISTTSILGGKNPFLGAAYIVVGVICWVLGLAFLVRHMIKPRKLGDHTYLSWNQPQATQANRTPGAPEAVRTY